MIAAPRSPGLGPSAYQPATEKSVGTWREPSGFRPSRTRRVATPIVGMDSRNGTERGTPVIAALCGARVAGLDRSVDVVGPDSAPATRTGGTPLATRRLDASPASPASASAPAI